MGVKNVNNVGRASESPDATIGMAQNKKREKRENIGFLQSPLSSSSS
jgi:hypothetical protein